MHRPGSLAPFHADKPGRLLPTSGRNHVVIITQKSIFGSPEPVYAEVIDLDATDLTEIRNAACSYLKERKAYDAAAQLFQPDFKEMHRHSLMVSKVEQAADRLRSALAAKGLGRDGVTTERSESEDLLMAINLLTQAARRPFSPSIIAMLELALLWLSEIEAKAEGDGDKWTVWMPKCDIQRAFNIQATTLRTWRKEGRVTVEDKDGNPNARFARVLLSDWKQYTGKDYSDQNN